MFHQNCASEWFSVTPTYLSLCSSMYLCVPCYCHSCYSLLRYVWQCRHYTISKVHENTKKFNLLNTTQNWKVQQLVTNQSQRNAKHTQQINMCLLLWKLLRYLKSVLACLTSCFLRLFSASLCCILVSRKYTQSTPQMASLIPCMNCNPITFILEDIIYKYNWFWVKPNI